MSKVICRALPVTSKQAYDALRERGQNENAALLEQGVALAGGKKPTPEDAIAALKRKLGLDAQVLRLISALRVAVSCGADYSAEIPNKPGDHKVKCGACGAVHRVTRT